jgi:hypothetical protein
LNEIVIESKRVDKYNVKSSIQVPNRIKKYVKTSSLFLKYDKQITDNKSILNIPMVSIVLPLAWLTDTDIRVDELDKRYSESMTLLREEINKIFPAKKYKANIYAEEIKENKIGSQGTGLIFSGGVDSTYSMITNLEKHPHLIMVWGIDMYPYPEYRHLWEGLEAIYSSFAERNRLEFSMIRTNASQILDEWRINHDFHEELHSGRVRLRHQHSLILIPFAAPLSIGRFNELLFAASHFPGFHFKEKSVTTMHQTDEKIVWADLYTKHDGFIRRTDKLEHITDFVKKDKVTLNVCIKPELNCCRCDKCYRTIMSLTLLGVDPNDYGFKVNEKTYTQMREHYEKAGVWLREPIMKMVPDPIEYDKYGSKDFFLWFKDFPFKSEANDHWFYRVVYNRLPYSLANIYDKLLKKININIHPDCYSIKHYSYLFSEDEKN